MDNTGNTCPCSRMLLLRQMCFYLCLWGLFLTPNQAGLKCLCCTPLLMQYKAVQEEQVVLQGFQLHQQAGFCNNSATAFCLTHRKLLEEIYFCFLFLVAAHYLLMPPFSYTAPCPHRQGPTNSGALGSQCCLHGRCPRKWHSLSECDTSSAPFSKDCAPYCCRRTVDLGCESTWVVDCE